MTNQNFQWNVKTMGVDYYPEQWDNSLWESDLTRMREGRSAGDHQRYIGTSGQLYEGCCPHRG